MKTALLLLLFFSVTSHADHFIVGGIAVRKADPIATTTVALLNGDALCTGSLLAEDLIVTAAHCVGPDPSRMKVVFKKKLTGEIPVADVLDYAVPREYEGVEATGKDQYDIALVRFEGKMPEGYSVAELLPASASLRDGETVVLSGFGISRAKTRKGAGTLRKTEVTVEDAEYARTEVLLDQTDHKGACHGDSGGPAFVEEDGNLLLWGVTSRGSPITAPDDCAHQSIYTLIQAHWGFLREAAARLRKGRYP